jgi:hypothetical protein
VLQLQVSGLNQYKSDLDCSWVNHQIINNAGSNETGQSKIQGQEAKVVRYRAVLDFESLGISSGNA